MGWWSNPEKVGEAIDQVRPCGVDVSSGIEIERGIKSPELMADFVRAVRDTDSL